MVEKYVYIPRFKNTCFKISVVFSMQNKDIKHSSNMSLSTGKKISDIRKWNG